MAEAGLRPYGSCRLIPSVCSISAATAIACARSMEGLGAIGRRADGGGEVLGAAPRIRSADAAPPCLRDVSNAIEGDMLNDEGGLIGLGRNMFYRNGSAPRSCVMPA